jgi:hypothetical protein
LIGFATSAQDGPDRIDFGGTSGPSPAVGVALAIAPCLSGQPCDSNSLFALGLCVGSDGLDCGDSVEASLAIRTLLRSNEVPVQDIAAQFKVNRSTLYRNIAASTI